MGVRLRSQSVSQPSICLVRASYCISATFLSFLQRGRLLPHPHVPTAFPPVSPGGGEVS